MFGMIAAWAIRSADSRSRELTGSDRSDIPTLALQRVVKRGKPACNKSSAHRSRMLVDAIQTDSF
jgi:hypothetical protein